MIKVFVGADRSQALAVKVLEHSIRRYSSLPVEVFPMIDLPVPSPKDPRNSQRTGFSFSRFCIPKLASYSGRAIYMDADMLVFKDIKALWEIPFGPAKVAIQSEVINERLSVKKEGAPEKRIKQCAVMLLNCSELEWDINTIVTQMDQGKFNYEDLLFNLCILKEEEINYVIPGEWNSLEYFDQDTCLIHYTDMNTQPWTSTKNQYAELWLDEVRLMLKNGKLKLGEIEQEIQLGFFRPSLLRDIKYGMLVPRLLKPLFNSFNQLTDKKHGYVPHKAVYEAKRIRDGLIKNYEQSLKLNT